MVKIFRFILAVTLMFTFISIIPDYHAEARGGRILKMICDVLKNTKKFKNLKHSKWVKKNGPRINRFKSSIQRRHRARRGLYSSKNSPLYSSKKNSPLYSSKKSSSLYSSTRKSSLSFSKERIYFSSRQILRKRLGITSKSLQAHHIIPYSLRNHPVLKKIGFDINNKINGMALPKAIHRGNHPSYTQAVKKELDKIPRNLSADETKNKVLNIISKARKEIEGKGFRLN